MPLRLHLSIHFATSILAWFIVYKYFYKNVYVFFVAILWWFLIDADHFVDYWFYLWHIDFNLEAFLSWEHFKHTSKLYLIFHWWEYPFIWFVLFGRLKNKIRYFVLSFSIALFLHISSDVFINWMKIEWYSISYRIYRNFEEKYCLVNP